MIAQQLARGQPAKVWNSWFPALNGPFVKQSFWKFACEFFLTFRYFFVLGSKMSLTASAGCGSRGRLIAVYFRGQEKRKVLKCKKKFTCKFSAWLLNNWLADSPPKFEIHDFDDFQYFCKGIKCKICKQIFFALIQNFFVPGFNVSVTAVAEAADANCSQFPRTRKEKCF